MVVNRNTFDFVAGVQLVRLGAQFMKSVQFVIAMAMFAGIFAMTVYPQFARANADCLPNDTKPICREKPQPEQKYKVCKSGKIVKQGESCGADGE